MLYWVTVTPYSHSFFTYLFISCPFSAVSWGPAYSHVCAGQWSSLRGCSHLGISFSLPAASWLWMPTVQPLWDNGSSLMCVRMFVLFMSRPLSPGINWIVPSGPLKTQKASNSFLLHMVLWPVILINYIWLHHVVRMGYAGPYCNFADQMVSQYLRPCLQLWHSSLGPAFAQKPVCCTYFCVEIPLAEPEQACNHHELWFLLLLIMQECWLLWCPRSMICKQTTSSHGTYCLSCIPCFISTHISSQILLSSDRRFTILLLIKQAEHHSAWLY